MGLLVLLVIFGPAFLFYWVISKVSKYEEAMRTAEEQKELQEKQTQENIEQFLKETDQFQQSVHDLLPSLQTSATLERIVPLLLHRIQDMDFSSHFSKTAFSLYGDSVRQIDPTKEWYYEGVPVFFYLDAELKNITLKEEAEALSILVCQRLSTMCPDINISLHPMLDQIFSNSAGTVKTYLNVICIDRQNSTSL